MAIEEIVGVMNFWDLFVVLTFGSFWITIIALALLMFIIMGFFGRISIYSVTWYIAMFFLSMTLGYGFTLISIMTSLSIVIAIIWSIKGYIDRGGQ